ncbi:MAG: hypothetical protein KBS66_05825 [Eubacterium sp.]|nr:hypothetical protein [Candidatus Colimonas fimequi]
MTQKQNKKSLNKITLGGIFLALTIIFLYGSAIIPRLELTMLGIASVMTMFMIIETGIGGGALLYVAASILGFLIVPDKIMVIAYILLFGYYGIIKVFLDRLPGMLTRTVAKALYFFVILTGAGIVLSGNLAANGLPMPLLIAAGIVILLIYDAACTYVISFYTKRFHGAKLDNFKLS